MDNIMTRLYAHVDYIITTNVDRFSSMVNKIIHMTGKKVIKVLEVGAGEVGYSACLSFGIDYQVHFQGRVR